MKVDVLVTDPGHPVVPALLRWMDRVRGAHAVGLIHRADEAVGGDALFLVSCGELVGPELRARYGHTLVLHASDLPAGRGWSPHVWDIVGGAEAITVCLLDAAEPVDSGPVWLRQRVEIGGGWLHDEINEALFAAEVELMDRWLELVERDEGFRPSTQAEDGVTWHRRRTPADSELDPERTLAEQFDLLRVADPDRFPAFFELRGRRYRLTLQRDPGDGR